MSFIFFDCYYVRSIYLSNFDESKVNDMSYMFGSCGTLTSLDVSKFKSGSLDNI